ncbi:Eco57I restriction-modification methylase domain-containing protein [Geomesophilobacter sediminis]|uniref:site-specific DNA-methyltransferase (adenine-specific) n=1 Tax=Geomesophilobacter sediminis TaxID=2798584 RepID=A0A8J7JM01_9BACT|nr:Eco57I restriction-modification methylase domain-containing protein [Geomesophilobacter sediminis]MBJ6725405.1 Eco57I restriction-modification methylase domain-containing protein [Geomesophilobacter sediminis]
MAHDQLRLELPSTQIHPVVAAAVEQLSASTNPESRGAIFTRTEVVEFILDLVGYTTEKPLHRCRLLEPSFGEGDFLLPIVRRLLASWRQFGSTQNAFGELGGAIRGVELHRDSFDLTRGAVISLLVGEGVSKEAAEALSGRWLTCDDFLLSPLDGEFDVIVGNPPYVRQELIPGPLLAEYRSRFETMYDRADLYVPFIERSLLSLKPGGSLSFICADRWMKNRYGGPLRKLIAEDYHLRVYVDMVDTPAFLSQVSAYPAITVISRDRPGPTRIARRPTIDSTILTELAAALVGRSLPKDSCSVREMPKVTCGAEPWLLESSDQTELIRRLEKEFPTLEEAGCKVGIGVATGADKAFIGNFETLDVEQERKLPLATTRDIESGEVHWRGLGVINPFADDGKLVDLNSYPRLRQYLQERRDIIARRHCAQKTPASWYRTIDRITPGLATKPKLLIPDIKGEAHVVYEEGRLYPHHNLYYVISNQWDLRALQAVLLSEVSRLFIATYSTKMRGGFLRFQAQYLRRIRLPLWRTVPQRLRMQLIDAALTRDLKACNEATFALYNLTSEEQAALGGGEG